MRINIILSEAKNLFIIPSVVAILIFISNFAGADVFKSITLDETQFRVIAEDTRGSYYRQGEDYLINSTLSGEDYKFNGGGPEGSILDGYGRVDLNKSLSKDIKDRGRFSSINVDDVINGNSMAQLKLVEYSSPIDADLFKHFHTTALLKEGIRMQQYAQWQQIANDPVYQLSTRSLLICVDAKLRGNMSLDGAINLCGKEKAFDHITTSKGVLKNSLAAITPGRLEDEIVKLTGDVNLSMNKYRTTRPTSRIGNIIADYHVKYDTRIKDVLKTFKENGSIETPILSDDLELAGFQLQSYQIRNVAMLQAAQREIVGSKLAAQLAYIKVIQRYNEADEYLRRALENPNVDPAYKPIIYERKQFIRNELFTLEKQKELTHDYAQAMTLILDQADDERRKTAVQIGD